MNEKRKVFISGPITGLEDTYRAPFPDAAQKVLDAGHIPINPALLPDGMTQRDYMTICASMLATADEILFLPGAEKSDGATAECALAVKMGIPQFTLDSWLEKEAPQKMPALGSQDLGMAAKGQATPHGGRNQRLFGAAAPAPAASTSPDTWTKDTAATGQSPAQAGTDDPELVRGFVAIFCEECGHKATYYARTPTAYHRCPHCLHETKIRKSDLLPAFANCKCGRRFKYMTNAHDSFTPHFEIECLDCGNPIDVQLNNRGTAYKTLGYEPWRRGGTSDFV